MRRLLVCMLAGAFGVPAMPAASRVAASSSVSCSNVSIPVTIEGQSGPIAGTLCTPAGARTLQVLVHGHTYNRHYWDPPYQPETYSYVRHANAAGYATLAIDRLGGGASWHPVSSYTTYDNNVRAVHQVIEAARRGDLGTPFNRIVLVGHSYGTLTSYGVAGKFGGVDALVATGGAHVLNWPFTSTNYPPNVILASADPKFAKQNLDPGYITTTDSGHNVFVNTDNADPELVHLNETTLKDVGSVAELSTMSPMFVENLTVLNASKAINIPVLAINGEEDWFFCNRTGGKAALPDEGAADCSSDKALTESERPFFGPNAQIEGKVIPGTGHGLTVERTAPQTYAAILDFLSRHLPA